MTLSKKISIIIVTYNSENLISDCIDSIYKYADISEDEFEIIVVDNSNLEKHQQLTEILTEYFPNKIKIIHNSQNGGYGQGNNIGINFSKSSLCCIMNPDVRFNQPLMQYAITKFQSNDNLSLLSFKQTGGANISYYIKPEAKPIIGVSIFTKIANYINHFSAKSWYLSGAFFFIDKIKFKQIGLFDENIFLYFEEPDISNRLLRKNYDIEFDSAKTYIHLTGDRNFNDFSFREEMKSLLYYCDKYKLKKQKIFRKYLTEYQFNLFIFRILGNRNRLEKIQKEIETIKSY